MTTLSSTEVVLVSTIVFLGYSIGSWYLSRRRRFQVTTPLNGPERLHPIWGWTQAIIKTDYSAEMYEDWVKEFGSVVGVPTVLWNQKIILADPKAVTHFYANDPTIYGQSGLAKVFIANLLGHSNILTAEGDQHKRLRKALTPAFSLAAIRRLTEVFYDSAHKAKTHWDTILDANGGQAIIEVQDWMNHISLDSIGVAGFGHEFNSLDGQPSPVVDLFTSLGSLKSTFIDRLVFLLSIPFPRIFTHAPTRRNQLLKRFRNTMSDSAQELLSRTKQETKALGEHSAAEKSVIGLLIKAESTTGSLGMTKEEVTSQMNVLLLAGYETTSISLTWALIELAKSQTIQSQLREELQQFADDPTYEQLMSTSILPILDGVVHETLRLHPPVPESNRVAKQDDIIPLSRPYITSNGTVVDRLTIAKGSNVTAPISMINRSKEFWGEDAKEFNPSRWLPTSAPSSTQLSEFMGHRHIMTFSDGPRMCLGKNFALAEFKAALFVLVKHFAFEFENGVEGTEIGFHRGIVKRPKIVGRDGAEVPMRVKRV
ncbi:cytochrome P450 [Flagelloscypha sp. PMI_526]|nr:cytochrome P450 [Flagelloscypha sp. PMI_526]